MRGSKVFEGQDIWQRWWRAATVATLAGALTLAGCAKSNDSGSATSAGPTNSTVAVTPQKVDDLAAGVPEDIRKSGKLVVGVTIPYAPNEFKDAQGKIVGFDVDLMNAAAGTLGLTTDYHESNFAKIIPSITDGTYDVGMASFTDTKDREQQVDFVTYFSAGTQWASRAGAPVDPNNACGKKVSANAGSTHEIDELPAMSRACVGAGKPGIQIIASAGQDAATNAVLLGQADALSADFPVTAWAIKESEGKLEAAGTVFDSEPYGWPVKKGSPLAQSLQRALEHLIKTGDYKSIATNWGVESGVIDKPVINGAIS
jgi:polar amino acid transport system substrate-binding protein